MKLTFIIFMVLLTVTVTLASFEDDLKKLEEDLAELTEKRKKEAKQTPTNNNDVSKLLELDETKIDDATKSKDDMPTSDANDDDDVSTALKELRETQLLYSLARQDDNNDPELKHLIEMSLEDALTKITQGTLGEVSDDVIFDESQEKKSLDCKDLRPANCKILAKRNYCTDKKYVALMQKMCLASCGYCKAPEIPKCQTTLYGCCGDHKTPRSDATGSNCPACKNRYDRLCSIFKSWCSKAGLPAGQFLIDHCPQTCDRCNKCEDHPKYSFYCAFWKEKLRWCGNSTKNLNKARKHAMSLYCKKTCGYC